MLIFYVDFYFLCSLPVFMFIFMRIFIIRASGFGGEVRLRNKKVAGGGSSRFIYMVGGKTPKNYYRFWLAGDVDDVCAVGDVDDVDDVCAVGDV